MALIILIRRALNGELLREIILTDAKALITKTAQMGFYSRLFSTTEGLVGNTFFSMFLMVIRHFARRFDH